MATTLEITPEYFTSGDFDSRNRFLRFDAGGPIYLCSGLTWNFNNRLVNTGQSWNPWRWSITGFTSRALTSTTVSGNTQTSAVDTPINTVTRMNF